MVVVGRGGPTVACEGRSAGLDWRKGIVGVRDAVEGGSAESLGEGWKRLRGLCRHDITTEKAGRRGQEGQLETEGGVGRSGGAHAVGGGGRGGLSKSWAGWAAAGRGTRSAVQSITRASLLISPRRQQQHNNDNVPHPSVSNQNTELTRAARTEQNRTDRNVVCGVCAHLPSTASYLYPPSRLRRHSSPGSRRPPIPPVPPWTHKCSCCARITPPSASITSLSAPDSPSYVENVSTTARHSSLDARGGGRRCVTGPSPRPQASDRPASANADCATCLQRATGILHHTPHARTVARGPQGSRYDDLRHSPAPQLGQLCFIARPKWGDNSASVSGVSSPTVQLLAINIPATRLHRALSPRPGLARARPA